MGAWSRATSDRIPVSSGAAAHAPMATGPNSWVTARNRARESRSNSATPSACSMVDTGTGIAPIRMAARYTTTNWGESAISIRIRCSGCSPSDRSPAAVRHT